MMRKVFTKAEFENELDDAGDRLVAVHFKADWCKQSDDVTRKLQEVMSRPEFAEVLCLQVDVDDNEDTAPFCEVDFLPTIQFYRFGRKVSEIYEDTIDNLASVLRLHR